jgi:hypothetical protein
MGAEVRRRRLRVGRALRNGRPIAAEDLELAIELARDKSARLKVAYVQGTAFVVILANGLWQMFPWSLTEVLILAGGLVGFGIYLVGIAYGIRVQRWLRRNS